MLAELNTRGVGFLSALSLALIVILCAAPPAQAQAQTHGGGPEALPPSLAVADFLAPDAFIGHVAWLRDPEGALSITQAMEAAQDGAMRTVPGRSADFGYTTDTIWLRVALTNPTDAADWRLRLRENFFQEFAAWVVPAATGLPELRVFQDTTTPFGSRAVAWPELVVPFALEPGASAELWLRYRSGGSSEIEFGLYDTPGFEAWADRKMARNFIYYGMLLFLIVAALVTWIVTRLGIFAAYSAYALAGLLFVMHGDGNTFRYLWPEAPGFNAFASIPLGGGIVATGAHFARLFLQTATFHPVFDAILRIIIVVALGMIAAAAVVDTQLIKKVLVLLAFVSILTFTASGINAARTRFREVRFYVLAWSGAVISSAIMTGRHWLGIEISEEVQYDSMRIVLVLDAALMGFAILDRFNQLSRSRSRALELSLSEAERSLALSRRLQDLERRYALAVELTASRERQVADAIHDLRQPLHALRLSVQRRVAGTGTAPGAEGGQIEEAFQYLERLVEEELAAPARVETRGVARDADGRSDETASLAEVLTAVEQMFRGEAIARGIDLRVMRHGAVLRVPVLSLMRMVSNLVSNALRHAPGGRVLVGVRRRPEGGLRIEVHDTGIGLTEAEFALACGRAVRLGSEPQESGSGLGLAIVRQSCEAHGLTLGLLPGSRGGASIGITVPPGAILGKMG